jgi:hypothetical protein
MSPVQLEDIVTYTLSQRNPSADPFDVIIEGHTDAADSSSEAPPNRRLRGCRTHLVGREARMVSRLGGRYAPAHTSRSAAEVRQRQRTTPRATSHTQLLSAASRRFAGLIQFSQASAVFSVRNERSGADDEGRELRRIGKAGVCPKRRSQPASRQQHAFRARLRVLAAWDGLSLACRRSESSGLRPSAVARWLGGAECCRFGRNWVACLGAARARPGMRRGGDASHDARCGDRASLRIDSWRFGRAATRGGQSSWSVEAWSIQTTGIGLLITCVL